MIEQHNDSVTIRGAPRLAATYRCVLAGIARRRLDGLPSADLQQLARALRRAHMSPTRHELAMDLNASPDLNGQDDDLISVGEAAALLGMSHRHVARLAADPGGLNAVRIGRTWVLRRSIVRAHIAQRKKASHD